MKKKLLFTTLNITMLFIACGRVYAQDPSCEAKCLSGFCDNGRGKYQFKDCTVYEGLFKNSQLDGQGKYTYQSGNVYEGNWNNGKRSGPGSLTYYNGDFFSGNWYSDQRQGYGTYKWTSGTIYEGNYENDVMKGKGTLLYNTGKKYVGEVLDGKCQGKGILYKADGSVEYDGYWENNKMVSPENNTNNSNNNVQQGSSSSDFCSDLKAVMSKSSDKFSSIKGSLRSEEGQSFKTKIFNTTQNISGAKDCYVRQSLGFYYYALFGEYSAIADADIKYNEILGKLKSCLPEKLFVSQPASDNLNRVQVKTKYSDGYNLYGDELKVFKNSNGKYEVGFSVSTNELNARVYTISNAAGSGDASFDSGVNKILSSCPSTFSTVLGAKHEENDFFGKLTVYDITVSLPGINKLSYKEGGMALTPELTGEVYTGTDEAEAKRKYEAMAEKVRKTLGSSYIYTKSNVSSGSTQKYNFSFISDLKKDKASIVMVRYSSINNKYYVDIVFCYKLFGGML